MHACFAGLRSHFPLGERTTVVGREFQASEQTFASMQVRQRIVGDSACHAEKSARVSIRSNRGHTTQIFRFVIRGNCAGSFSHESPSSFEQNNSPPVVPK